MNNSYPFVLKYYTLINTAPPTFVKINILIVMLSFTF